MTIECGTEWGAPWGSYYGPCDPTDHVALLQSEARARLMEGETFAALVQLIGETFDSIEHDAWMLTLRLNLSAAPGVILDQLGDNVGLRRLSVGWTDSYYRKVLGAWIACGGSPTIQRLHDLLSALSDGAVAFTIEEHLPGHVEITTVGLDQDAASIWVEVIEPTRPKGIQYWLHYSVINPAAFIVGESLLGGPDVLVGTFEM